MSFSSLPPLPPSYSGLKSVTSTSGLLYPRLLMEVSPQSVGVVTRADAGKWLALQGAKNPCYQKDLENENGNKEKVFLLALNSMLLSKYNSNVLAWRAVSVTELRLGYNPQVGRIVSKQRSKILPMPADSLSSMSSLLVSLQNL